jgi:hypothetical protein
MHGPIQSPETVSLMLDLIFNLMLIMILNLMLSQKRNLMLKLILNLMLSQKMSLMLNLVKPNAESDVELNLA